ncbi:hypothetical protein A3F66_03150 [candidate division TM6 bacterium RIFCSPHIGHO2_12_FULL_32_22]|nr:MAG: hypothetical protein A3F66_03150 [candidate division TM6 bacterium RIFCSPHIGHO2_12_FULL_32_22]
MPIILDIKVFPNSGKQEFKIDNDQLKCYLKSSPEKGKANQELIKMLSKQLNLGQFNFSILSGMTTRLKKVRVNTDLSLDEVLKRLNGAL